MIVDIAQGTPEWHVWRAGGIGASDVATVINWPYAKMTARALWMIRTGRKPGVDLSKNYFVLRGHRCEPWARAAMEQYLRDHRGIHDVALPACIQHDEYDFIRVSLDGLLSNGVATELKVPAWETFEKVMKERRQSEGYLRYWPQVQDQMLVTGADYGFLSFYRAYDNRLVVFEIERDQSFIDQLIDRQSWWWDLYQKDIAPPLTAGDHFEPENEEDQAKWVDISVRLRETIATIAAIDPKLKEAKKIESELKQQLRLMVGEVYSSAEYAGVKLNIGSRVGSVDFQAYLGDLAQQHPDIQLPNLDNYRKPPTEQVRVTTSEYNGEGAAASIFEFV